MLRCRVFVEIRVLAVVDSDGRVTSRDRRKLPCAWELGRMVTFMSIPNLSENVILCVTERLLDTSTTCT